MSKYVITGHVTLSYPFDVEFEADDSYEALQFAESWVDLNRSHYVDGAALEIVDSNVELADAASA